jgi:hypothetical protein
LLQQLVEDDVGMSVCWMQQQMLSWRWQQSTQQCRKPTGTQLLYWVLLQRLVEDDVWMSVCWMHQQMLSWRWQQSTQQCGKPTGTQLLS